MQQAILLSGAIALAAANPLDLFRRQAGGATVTVTVSASTTTSENLFPTSPEIYPGNTVTGAPAGLALTNPVNGYGLPNATQTYVSFILRIYSHED